MATKESKTRIYKVTNGTGARLVRASSKAGARNHVARESISAGLASQDGIATLVASGVKIETAITETEQEPAAAAVA